MPRRSSEFELEAPWKGLVTTTGDEHQPHGTATTMKNVRLIDQKTDKRRLSKRAGLSKYVSTQFDSGPIQDINQYIFASHSDTASTQVRRETTNLAVCEGTLEKFTSSSVSAVTGGASVLSSSVHQIFSARLFDKVYYVDGTNDKVYNGGTNAIGNWTASPGTLPSGTKLIELWRGRIVLSGSASDPQNYFMSRQGDADDWDYSPDPTDEQQALAGNNSPAGKIGDVVNTMIPFSDDMLVFGCDHSIWQMSGDPAAGGRVDNISESTGMAWGRPWCIDPQKYIYFFGSRGGVWRLTPGGSPPDRISQLIDSELYNVNLQENVIRMSYDTRFDLVHLFITPIGGTTAGTHYVYDPANEAWMTDEFASYNYDPYSVYVLDADDPDDRVMLIGGKDGYIRKFDPSVEADDGSAFATDVWLNPITFRDDNWAFLKETHVIMSNNTNAVNIAAYGGKTAYAAKNASAAFTRALSSGKNYSVRQRAQGARVFVRLYNEDVDDHWSLESIRVRVDSVDSKRKRWE